DGRPGERAQHTSGGNGSGAYVRTGQDGISRRRRRTAVNVAGRVAGHKRVACRSVALSAWGFALASVAAAAQGEYVGSKSCAPCHATQFRSFQQTAMARSLAFATPAGAPIQFFHAKTGRRYRVYHREKEFLIE